MDNTFSVEIKHDSFKPQTDIIFLIPDTDVNRAMVIQDYETITTLVSEGYHSGPIEGIDRDGISKYYWWKIAN